MTDHKAVLRKLAEDDGCQASLKAADHIEYIERRLISAADGQQEVNLLTEEVAYQHWHRLLFARFLAENGLLRED